MSLWSDLSMRLRALFGRARLDAELREELRFHVDMQADALVKGGMPPAEAARRARISLGPAAAVAEETHAARGTLVLDDLRRDVAFAIRQLRRSPAFSCAAILTLGLGIGATTAIYSVLDGVLFKEAPFAHAERLVMLWETDTRSGTTREPGAWPDYVDYRDRARTLDGLAAVMGNAANLALDGNDPRRLAVVATTHNYFDLVGIRPLLGRFYTAAEDRPGPATVAVLGERLWRAAFGADSAVLGRVVRVNDQAVEIVGVAPGSAEFGLDQIHRLAAYHASYDERASVDLFVPLNASEERFSRDTHPFLLVGRLGPGASVGTAQVEASAIAVELERVYPSNTARGAFVEPLGDVVFGESRPTLYLLMGVVVLLLLVACVNVANLLLARGEVRARELAVRQAIGASGGRLERQLLTEALTLAFAGAVAGIGVAVIGLRLIGSFAPAGIPRIAESAIDGRVLLVALAATGLVGLAFGMLPALHARRRDVIAAIRGSSPNASHSVSRRRFGNVLMIGELALAVSLTVCAGLLLRSFRSVIGVDPGFQADQVYKAHYQLPESRYPADFRTWPNWTQQHGARERIVAAAQSAPGTIAAAIATAHPLDEGFTNSWQVVGREAEAADWPEISVRIVTAGYFATVQARLIRGRTFEAQDDASGPLVALINETAARRFFDGMEPIGREIRFWGQARRIVGVVGDERIKGLTNAPPPITYVPLEQNPSNSGVLLVRSSGDPNAVMASMVAAVRDVDPQLAVFGVEPLESTLLATVSERRFALYVVGVFALATLALAFIGIHGLVAYLAAQRTKEMGIRMALGATGASVAGLVLRGTLTVAGVGILIGLALGALGSRALGALLFGVTRLDPLTYLLVAGAAVVTAALAGIIPAARAARTAPIIATRE